MDCLNKNYNTVYRGNIYMVKTALMMEVNENIRLQCAYILPEAIPY